MTNYCCSQPLGLICYPQNIVLCVAFNLSPSSASFYLHFYAVNDQKLCSGVCRARQILSKRSYSSFATLQRLHWKLI